ncbi:mannose-6-phosphate isomerase [Planctomycetales bacterium ZRK34]|nr:mannose-6-phosphate isomerase [Planctomycetales bacterium ZRK34]
MKLYPIRFEPIYLDKVWGGRTLEHLGRQLPAGSGDGPPPAIGEAWEIADLGSTSGSGAGGSAVRSRVAEGPLAGRTLHELVDEYGELLAGTTPMTESGNFPLLIKYLDARQHLSVQVHPSPRYAREHPEAHLKSEAWYVVEAEPDAAIYKGVHDGVTPEQFRAAIDNDTVEDLMIRIPVQPGDCHYLPSGTCHALGAGLLVAEVQTPSDTTFRVYDWGRPRELHIEQALQCIQFGPAHAGQYEPGTMIHREGHAVETLVHCEHFRMEKIIIDHPQSFPVVNNHQVRIAMVLEGEGMITCNGALPKVRFQRGDTLLIPAELEDPVAHFDKPASFLNVTIPSAMDHVIA